MTSIPESRPLRHFLQLWSSAIGLAFLLMALGAGFALNRLNQVARSQLTAAARLQTARDFEDAALEANRRPNADWHHADRILEQLKIDLAARPDLLQPITTGYEHLKTNYDPVAPWNDERGFLDAFRTYRAEELGRIAEETQNGDEINRQAAVGLLLICSLSFLGLWAGGSEIWNRVFLPTLSIAEAARRFGQGNLKAQVDLRRNDELGQLGTVFNGMADALEERENERLRFVAAVAHDLKSPLVVIGGVARLLQERPDKFTPEEQVEWLEKIARASKQMETTVHDLTDAVQSQTGTLSLRMEPCDLAALVCESVRETAFQWQAHRIVYEGPDRLIIRGDALRLQRVAANLLSNAAKYSSAGTLVTVRLEVRGKNACLCVQDEGTGIAPEDIPRLFTPFVRLERTTAVARGTGLGLTSMKRIVEGHGGCLSVESELGVGSTFTVTIPVG
jgi:signal transduction histidine kinase